MAATHRYRTQLSWSGRTADGYRAYPREHRVAVAGETLSVSADSTYLGDASMPNPENLLLAAASSCQLLSFLALAARNGLDVRAYSDEAEAVMPVSRDRMRITQIVLRPRIVLGPGAEPARVHELAQQAHRDCFIANTLNADIVLEPSVEVMNA